MTRKIINLQSQEIAKRKNALIKNFAAFQVAYESYFRRLIDA